MADAAETPLVEVDPEVGEKKEDSGKTNGGGEVITTKVEELGPEGSAESYGVEDVEGESKPEDVVAEAKTEEEAAVETVVEVKQEEETVNEVAASGLSSEARIPEEEAAPEEVIKDPEEPKEVPEAEKDKQIAIPSVVEDVSEKAVIEEALEAKKEEFHETATPSVAEASIPRKVIEDKAVVEEAVKEEKPADAESKDESVAVTESEATGPVKPEKKHSRNVISRMKRSFSKVKKAFAGQLPGSKAESNAEQSHS